MVNNGIALLISPIILFLLIKSLKHKIDISILLYANIYIRIFTFSLVLFIDNIDILKGDYGLFIAQDTFICRLRGYLVFVSLSAVRNALVLQVCYFKGFLFNAYDRCF